MNKRSLAPPRRQSKPMPGHNNTSSKKNTLKTQQRTTSTEKNYTFSAQSENSDRTVHHKYQERFRNKNLQNLPTQLLLTFSTLTTIDVSYNKLTDADIELMIGSCTKLTTFCIQGNQNYLIPSAIVKLKHLVNFRHDWCKLSVEHYQTPERLRKIMQNAKRPDVVTKINRIVGLDFMAYCQNVLETHMDKKLLEKIQKVDVSTFARTNMLKIMSDVGKGKVKEKGRLATVNQAQQKSLIPGCFGACTPQNNKDERKNQQKQRQLPNRRRQLQPRESSIQGETQIATSSIRIEDIRDIPYDIEASSTQATQNFSQQIQSYSCPGMPLHKLFANFDKNSHGPADVDALLLKNYNPNQNDQNGLSPYHICIIYNQKKGLQYLLQISSNNPGFFDLQMNSVKEGRNILHYSVFLKNYAFTKMLIQFGMPTNKRDTSGARILHLVDQNCEFLLLLRKLLKKKSHIARNLSTLSVPHFPHQNKKYYTKHPHRQMQQCKLRIQYSKNDQLLNMYELATGVPKIR